MLGRYLKKNASDGGIPWQVGKAMASTLAYSLQEIESREPAAKKAKVTSIAGRGVPGTSIKNNVAVETTCPPVRDQSAFSEDENKLVCPSNNLDQTPKKGPFSQEEDKLIREQVQQRGHKWREIAELLPGRTDNQVRQRYLNRLDPSLKKDAFSGEEDKLIFEQVQQRGCKWSEIAALLPGRTGYQVRRRYENVLDPSIVWTEASESSSTSARLNLNRECCRRIYSDNLNVTCDGKVFLLV